MAQARFRGQRDPELRARAELPGDAARGAGRPRRTSPSASATIETGYTGSSYEGLWVAGVLDALKHGAPLPLRRRRRPHPGQARRRWAGAGQAAAGRDALLLVLHAGRIGRAGLRGAVGERDGAERLLWKPGSRMPASAGDLSPITGSRGASAGSTTARTTRRWAGWSASTGPRWTPSSSCTNTSAGFKDGVPFDLELSIDEHPQRGAHLRLPDLGDGTDLRAAGGAAPRHPADARRAQLRRGEGHRLSRRRRAARLRGAGAQPVPHRRGVRRHGRLPLGRRPERGRAAGDRPGDRRDATTSRSRPTCSCSSAKCWPSTIPTCSAAGGRMRWPTRSAKPRPARRLPPDCIRQSDTAQAVAARRDLPQLQLCVCRAAGRRRAVHLPRGVLQPCRRPSTGRTRSASPATCLSWRTTCCC